MPALAIAVFSSVFVYRVVTLELINDHFVHLSRAQQIVLGEVPVRDFFEPGAILQSVRVGRSAPSEWPDAVG